MSVASLRAQLRKRKQARERKRRLKQGYRAKREARGVRKLRKRLERAIKLAAAPTKMYDATTVGNIPRHARAVAGYVNGLYTTFPLLIKYFPKAHRLSIAVNAEVDADILDIESGDATNDDAISWFSRKPSNRGFYTSVSNVNALVSKLETAGIHRDQYILWTAHYSLKHICGPKTCNYGGNLIAAADGTQWTTHGETVDESKIRRNFFLKLK